MNDKLTHFLFNFLNNKKAYIQMQSYQGPDFIL